MRKRSTLKALKNGAIYGALLAASAVGRRLSLPAARRWGSRFGGLAWSALARERRKALRNLAVAFPHLADVEREQIGRAAFRHLGTSLFEIAWMPNLTPEMLVRTTRIEGLERLREAAASGRGVVLFAGHCGNWEWMCAAIGLSGIRMNVIAREIYDERLNDFIVASRRRFGVETIGRGSASSGKEILQTLRRGDVLGLLIDQSLKVESVAVPFFGIPASTPVGPAKLAVRSGALAIAGFIHRDGDGIQHLRFQEIVDTAVDSDPIALTAMMTRRIEEQIRSVPEQWVWMHERWRERAAKNGGS
jgi:Kdo2-lipid IVA lauroyltransferase/acyltransferase